MLSSLFVAGFLLSLAGSWIFGGMAARNQAPGVHWLSDMATGRRGLRGLLWLDLGKRAEFNAVGWRYRNISLGFGLGALVCLVLWFIALSIVS
jgi:hypothetical protein